jgi:hypothetical protein
MLRRAVVPTLLTAILLGFSIAVIADEQRTPDLINQNDCSNADRILERACLNGAQSKVLENGKTGFLIECSPDRNACYRNAGDICGDRNYFPISLESSESVWNAQRTEMNPAWRLTFRCY